MFGILKKTALAAAAVIGLSAGAASAASCQYGDSVEFGLFQADVYTSTACVGPVSGNDDVAAISGLFLPAANWEFSGKINVPDPRNTFTGGSDGLLTMTLNPDGMSGTWSVANWSGVAQAMLVLKGGRNFAAYLLDLTAGTSGEWRTTSLVAGNSQNTPALSHMSLYTVAAVPLPAAGFLLIGALGGLAALRRRKTA